MSNWKQKEAVEKTDKNLLLAHLWHCISSQTRTGTTWEEANQRKTEFYHQNACSSPLAIETVCGQPLASFWGGVDMDWSTMKLYCFIMFYIKQTIGSVHPRKSIEVFRFNIILLNADNSCVKEDVLDLKPSDARL